MTAADSNPQLVRLAIVAGARPNFMKVAPLMAALSEEENFELILIHTGQHYDESMSGNFFRDLDIPAPQYHLEVGSGSHAQQTAEIMRRLEPVLMQSRPAGVIVVGDVNSTAAAALVAAKLRTPVVHVEAGLRSFDRSMPEEINRIVTDAVSDLFLVTEESGYANLREEGKPADRIVFVGNLMVDTLRHNLQAALASNVRERLGIPDKPFGLVTLHRPANVDDESSFGQILQALAAISNELPLYWPIHPRTAARIRGPHFQLPRDLHLLEPLGYLDFLHLQAKCSVVLTDSGGIQEESTALGIPCLTLRENTERPVTLERGTNRLAGTKKDSILRAWVAQREASRSAAIPPLWDGNAAVRCREAIKDFFSRQNTSLNGRHTQSRAAGR